MTRTVPSAAYPSFPEDASAVSPSDTDTFEPSVIYVGTAGNVKVTTCQGTDVTFTAVPAGTRLPVRVKRVWQNGTSALNMVRIF